MKAKKQYSNDIPVNNIYPIDARTLKSFQFGVSPEMIAAVKKEIAALEDSRRNTGDFVFFLRPERDSFTIHRDAKE